MWPEEHLCLYRLVKANMCSSMLDWYALMIKNIPNYIVWIVEKMPKLSELKAI